MLPVAVVFTVACVVLSGNAVLSFWPNICPGFTPPAFVLYIEGVLSVVSSGLFLVGGVFSFLDVVRIRRGESLRLTTWKQYGTVIIDEEAAVEDKKVAEKSRRESVRVVVAEVLERTTSLARSVSLTGSAIDGNELGHGQDLGWQGLPTLDEIRRNHLPHLPFIASVVSLTSSLIYTVTAVLALISIFRTSAIATWIRYPQLAAALGFAISSWLAMVQAADSWWRPAVRTMAWHANLLNLIGSLGFVLCSVLGLLQHSWAEWQFGCTFLWGSWAFLVASAMSSYNAYRRERRQIPEDSKV